MSCPGRAGSRACRGRADHSTGFFQAVSSGLFLQTGFSLTGSGPADRSRPFRAPGQVKPTAAPEAPEAIAAASPERAAAAGPALALGRRSRAPAVVRPRPGRRHGCPAPAWPGLSVPWNGSIWREPAPQAAAELRRLPGPGPVLRQNAPARQIARKSPVKSPFKSPLKAPPASAPAGKAGGFVFGLTGSVRPAQAETFGPPAGGSAPAEAAGRFTAGFPDPRRGRTGRLRGRAGRLDRPLGRRARGLAGA